MIQYVAYYRVSTRKQGNSGLGIASQKGAVTAHLSASGGELIKEFEEIESGKDDNRPQLQEALDYCELSGATLIIAKLDRLSRNVAFLANLLDSKAKFLACDNPQANELTIHILAAVAQEERKAISIRTKAALAQAKARGVKLGNPKLNEARAARKGGNDMTKANQARKTKAAERASKVLKAITFAKDNGHTTLREVARFLNTNTHIRTPRGYYWTATSVRRVIKIIKN